MKPLKLFFLSLVLSVKLAAQNDFTIAFGSCNKPTKPNILWDDILDKNPDVWIWGGDNIYADTENMEKMKNDYQLQKQVADYKKLTDKTSILAVWDDHDYGRNDAGKEYAYKKQSQQLFLDFLNVSKHNIRRKREGTYHSKTFNTPKGSIKIFLLDTRYFRSKLTRDSKTKKYQKNTNPNATVLGRKQWKWLTNELNTSEADFNIIVSSIQVIADKHGFEKWDNFPKDRVKLLSLIASSKANNVIILSGDRHISEFSKLKTNTVNYPIIDFTSSGLTHAYKNFKKEHNPYRVKKVIHQESFGLLLFDFQQKKVKMQMHGNGKLLQEITQSYN